MKKEGSVLGLVWLTVFLDVVGFSILFPLFPALLEHYLSLEGTDSLVGVLNARLQDWSSGHPLASATLFGGILGSLYSLLQFLFAPVWGSLSDRHGRRPLLLLTLTGTVLANVLWVFAGSFGLLVLARLIGGIMAGNISAASAIVADTTSGRDRAKGMGMLGMAIGLGFICGPLIAIAVYRSPDPNEVVEWTRGFALNPFSGPALAAVALSLANLLWAATHLHETLPPEERGQHERVSAFNLVGQLRRLEAPGLLRTNLVYFLFLTAFAAMEFTLTFLAVERFEFTPRDNGLMFAYVGLILAFVQGGLVRRLAPRLGERKVAFLGLGLLVPAFLAVGAAPTAGALFGGLAFMAAGSALAMPCLSSLASRYAPSERQGLALGTFRALGSLSRALGPFLGGLLYWRWSAATPYLAGAAFLLVPIALLRGLPPIPERARHAP